MQCILSECEHPDFCNRNLHSGVLVWLKLVHPHQRCGYSDSPFARKATPFARKDTFLYCRVQKWVEGYGPLWAPDTKRKLYLRKIHFFVMEKYIEDARQERKDVPDLLEAIMRHTCKRRVTANFVQNESIWVQNHKNQGFNFLDSGNPMFSRRRPMPGFSPPGFQQYLAPLAAKYSKKCGF